MADSVNYWFKEKILAGNVSNKTCIDLNMRLDSSGVFAIDSSYTAGPIPNRGFFPIDDFTNPNNLIGTTGYTGALERNYHYCMVTNTKFTYSEGQEFTFSGDDDVWVYINGTLALDLGGRHQSLTATILLAYSRVSSDNY